MPPLRSLLAIGLLLLAGCNSYRPCKTDSDCGAAEICAESKFGTEKVKQKQCTATCVTDTDCVLAGKFGKSCRPIQDTASGPANTNARSSMSNSPGQNDPTSRGAIRICRDNTESLKK